MEQTTAVALWNELERGAWTIVDCIDRGERRYVVARPTTRPHALTARERAVVKRASRGWSNKLIAYDLGVATSTVSTHLSHAASKLAAGTRAMLIQIYAALAAPRPEVAVDYVESGGKQLAVIAMPLGSMLPASLSNAERAVAARAIAGESNAQIARARGVSSRTVEHQLASAMKKLGASSRSELVAALFSLRQTT